MMQIQVGLNFVWPVYINTNKFDVFLLTQVDNITPGLSIKPSLLSSFYHSLIP